MYRGKIALEVGKKGEAKKQMMTRSRHRELRNGVALKSAKQRDSRRLALKSRNHEHQAVKTARKGAAKHSTADAKSSNSRSRKNELSLLKKSGHASNG
jgi:hypothetical protein